MGTQDDARMGNEEDVPLEDAVEDPFSSLLAASPISPREDEVADDPPMQRPPTPELLEQSPEVLRAIEAKRQLALEKRRQRLSQLQASASTSWAETSPGDTSRSGASPDETEPCDIPLGNKDFAGPDSAQIGETTSTQS